MFDLRLIINTSTVREAMVKLMMENAAQAQQLQAQQQLQHTALSFFGFGFTRDQAASTMVDVDRREDKCEGGDLLPSPLLEGGDPSKCIMWCAIALGALVLGVPVAKVGSDGAAWRGRQVHGPLINLKYL